VSSGGALLQGCPAFKHPERVQNKLYKMLSREPTQKKKKLPVELLYLWTSENCSPKDQNSQLSSGALLQ
jgi:hypothetical protein